MKKFVVFVLGNGLNFEVIVMCLKEENWDVLVVFFVCDKL